MKHKIRYLKNTAGRLAPFISPYKGGFFLSVLMVCLTTLTLSISPSVEGMANYPSGAECAGSDAESPRRVCGV